MPRDVCRAALVTVTTALALLAPAAGGAATTGFITVRPGDLIAVKGGALGCVVQLPGIVCYPSRAGKPRTGVFAVMLVAPGVASILRVGKDLSLTPVVTKVAPGTKLHRRGRTITLAVGQVARLQPPAPAGPIDCAVVRSAGLPTLYCSQDDAVGPVVGSFAIVVNTTTAAIGRVGADRGTTIVSLRKQPKA